MKSRKRKLISILFAFILSIGALTFGVYAAVTATLNASGTVTFNAYGIDVDVDGSITGAIGTDIITTYSGTTNKTREPCKALISGTPWTFGNLEFDEESAMDLAEIKISFEIKISNYSNFPIEASATVPSITGLTITKEDIFVIDAYNSSLGAGEQSIIVTLSPISYETPVNLASLNLTINISKTLHKETDISKFIWGTPANGEIAIIGNNLLNTDTDIIIPRKNGSNRVTSIGDYAFNSCRALTSVIIGNVVTSISNSAFAYCSALTSVTIGSGLTSIGGSAFSYCSALTSVIISNSVKSIGSSAFYDCSTLTSVTIPNSVESIGDYAFSGCSALTTITIPNSVISIGYSAFGGTAWYNNQVEGIVYAGKVLYKYKGTCPSVINNIKSDTVAITDSAFASCSSLTSITIPKSVKSIGENALYQCYALLAINVEAGNANYYSDNGVLINKNNSTLIQYPIANSSSSYVIPSTVTSIGQRAFEDCNTLTNITIPNSLISIGWGAFMNCGYLTNITIPNSVESIGEKAFSDCNSLVAINVDSGNANYSSDDGVLLNKSKTSLIRCPGAKNSYIIPSNVTSIGNDAFADCHKLTSIIIPDSVISIGSYAFESCSALESVYFERTSVFISLGNWCFTYLKSGSVLYFKNQVVMDQFTNIHYESSKTTKALY